MLGYLDRDINDFRRHSVTGPTTKRCLGFGEYDDALTSCKDVYLFVMEPKRNNIHAPIGSNNIPIKNINIHLPNISY